MALSQRLQLRQTQSLVMTPQLLQAIKLLQLSHLDLTAYVETEIERNPLLERDTGEPAMASPRLRRKRRRMTLRGRPSGSLTNSRQAAPRTRKISTPISKCVPRRAGRGRSSRRAQPPILFRLVRPRRERARRWLDYNLEAFVASEPTLADHLAEQLALATGDPAERLIGRHLLDLVNEAGYLVGDLAEVADRLGTPAAKSGSRPRAAADPSVRPASARATSPNASRSSSGSATSSIPPCRR